VVSVAICTIVGWLVGIAAGALMFRGRGRHAALPPASAKQLARAARANRADLQHMRARAAASRGEVPDIEPIAMDHFDDAETHQ
jgi:hypothetical protein